MRILVVDDEQAVREAVDGAQAAVPVTPVMRPAILGLGAVAGRYPAIRAARLAPAEALRTI